MAIITVTTTVSPDIMDEQWEDREAAAEAFAEALKEQWEKDLKCLRNEGHTVILVIEAKYTVNDRIEVNVEASDDDIKGIEEKMGWSGTGDYSPISYAIFEMESRLEGELGDHQQRLLNEILTNQDDFYYNNFLQENDF